MHLKPFGPFARFGASAVLLLALAFGFAGTAFAAWISLGQPEGSRVETRVLESSPQRVVVEYTIPGFYADPVVIDGSTYYRISLPHEPKMLQVGMPELPHVARSVIVSDVDRMEVHLLDSETQEFSGLPVVPSKGSLLRTVDPATVAYTFGSAYGTDRWFPDATVSGGEPYVMRDYRGMAIDASPFQTRGSDGTLRVARRMVIEAVATGPSMTNVIRRSGPPTKVVDAFASIYANHFINYEVSRYVSVPERGRMLIIAYDGFHDAMAPFVQWKLQEGIPTEIVDVSGIGNNSTSIKSYIQNYYGANPDLAFVLLVGDAAQVTTPHTLGGASDPSYSLLTGGDRYPEVIVGRFSAETVAQAETQVQRSIAYEQASLPAGWFTKGTGIGSDQGTGDDGEYDYQHIGNIRTKLLNYGYTLVDGIYDPGATVSMVTSALNNGRSIVNYCGHGFETGWTTTGFSNTNVNQLQNDWMLPFIISVACVNGQFEGTTCFAEAWMRATRNGNPTGAIGTYMSSINQYWNEPMDGQDASIDLLVQDVKHTFGGLCYNGSCQMMDDYHSSGGDMFVTWHIFGDPSLLVRTKTPQEMAVQHDGSYQIGQETYGVTVPGVDGALCALYADGILYGSAYTDPSGSASIVVDPPPQDPMTLTLTVTAYNKLPYTGQVEVVPPTNANVQFLSLAVADTTGGDGDGSPDAGESIALTMTLENIGTDPAMGVTATLQSDDPYVIVQTATESYGDIPPGGTAVSQGAYEVTLAPGTPDDHEANLTLVIHAQPGSWRSTCTLHIGRPVLVYASQHDDDAPPLGNGSGWIRPGETFDLYLTLADTGHANARNVVASVMPGNVYVDIVNGRGTISGIDAGGEGTSTPIRLHVRDQCPSPSVATIRVSLSADFGYMGTILVPIQIGGFLDDFETATGWSVGAPGDSASQGNWLRADPVGTTYGGEVVQPEDDHTTSAGTTCFVTGNGRVGGPADSSDVSGGRTTLLSPVFDLHAVMSATASYWVWYTNDRGDNPGEDVWEVDVTSDGGATWIPLEQTTTSTDSWAQRSFLLNQYVQMTSQVQLRFVASDLGGNSLVEGLVDDFVLGVTEAGQADAPIAEGRGDFAIDRIAPNPASGPAEIRYHVAADTRIDFNIYDVQGRLVRTLMRGEAKAGAYGLTWDRRNNAGAKVGAGIYYVRMKAGGGVHVRRVTLLD